MRSVREGVATSASVGAARGPVGGGFYFLFPMLVLASLRGFWAPDEPRYAAVARAAYEHEFLVMHLNGELYPDKPPLVFWLAGAFGRLFDWNELAMRLPSLVATLLLAWSTARLARRLWGELEARWAPLMVLGTAMVIEIGGRLQLDPVLAALCLASIERATDDRGTGSERLRARLLGGALAGLAALAKGPVAWLHVGVGILALRRASPSPTPGTSGRGTWAVFALLAVLPVLAWAGFASAREPRLVGPLFFGQHVGRVVEGTAHRGPPWEHLAHFPLYFLPFTPFFLVGVVRAIRDRGIETADRALRAVVIWFGVLFVVFSAMPPKRDLYLLPIYPAAALVCARVVGTALRGERPLARGVGRASAGAWMLVGAAGLAAVGYVANSGPPPSAAVAAAWTFVAEHGGSIGGVLLAVFLGGAFAWRAFGSGRLAVGLDRLGSSTALAAMLAAVFLVPSIDTVKCSRELALRVAGRPERPAEIVCVGVQPEGYRFYARLPAVKGDLETALDRDGADFIALVARKNWSLLPETVRARLCVLDSADVGAREVLVVGRAPVAAR